LIGEKDSRGEIPTYSGRKALNKLIEPPSYWGVELHLNWKCKKKKHPEGGRGRASLGDVSQAAKGGGVKNRHKPCNVGKSAILLEKKKQWRR